MSKKLVPIMMLFLLNTMMPVLADEFDFIKTEQIGELSLGLSEKSLKNKLHCAFKRDEDIEWAADGAYHQTWHCKEAGLSFDMVSNHKGGNKTIASITVTAPSTLKTKRGIQIGNSESAVTKAYQKERNAEDSQPKQLFVAGSVYGGLMFEFKNDKVESIFLGAGAE